MVWKCPCFLLIYCLVSLSPPYFLFLFPVLSLAYCIILNQAHRFFWEQGAELTQNLLEHSEMCQPLEFLINFFRLRPTDLTTVSASVSKGERVRRKLIFSVVQTCPFLQRYCKQGANGSWLCETDLWYRPLPIRTDDRSTSLFYFSH